MSNLKHIERLRKGREFWNDWVSGSSPKVTIGSWIEGNPPPAVKPELSRADLAKADLSGFDLRGADLRGAILRGANLRGAVLADANLGSFVDEVGNARASARLKSVMVDSGNSPGHLITATQNQLGADLSQACLIDADLTNANLHNALIERTELCGVDLRGADLSGSTILDSDVTGACMGWTILAKVRMERVKGIDTLRHVGPSSIGIDTFYRSRGVLTYRFLEAAGVPQTFLEYFESLGDKSVFLSSCFISHSTPDHLFAEQLHRDLQIAGVRCWFAPHDMKAGKEIYAQLQWQINQHDRLVLILSEHSMKSKWVAKEIEIAQTKELLEHCDVLLPVALVPHDQIIEWASSDALVAPLAATRLQETFIPDFSHWREPAAYERAFKQVMRELTSSTWSQG